MIKIINPQSYQEHKIPISQQSAQEQIEEIISQLPSQVHFLKVFPFNKSKIFMKSSQKGPHVLTYEDNDQLLIQDLIDKYAFEMDRKSEASKMHFMLEGGHILSRQKTIKQIKKQLRVDILDGLEVYLEVLNKLLFYIDECQIETIIQREASYNKKAVEIEFILPDIKYSIYLPFQGEGQTKKVTKAEGEKIKQEEKQKAIEAFEQVTVRLATEILRIFGKQVKPKNITLAHTQNNTLLTNQMIRFKKLFKDDKIKVIFKDKLVLPPPPRENNSILIIQGEGIKENKNHYDDIKEKKVKDLLNQIEPRPNWSDFGIKIGDLVIKPNEKFSKGYFLMKNSNQNWKNLSGVLINEAQMFEAEQAKIKKLCGKFNLEKVVDKKKTNLDLRQTCDKMIRERAKNVKHVYFKGNIENIEPIFIYTSQLQVKPSLREKSGALYRILNSFLRNQLFGQINEEQYVQIWEYLFTNHLLEQLKNIIPISNCVLYRGVSFLPNHKIGDKILYKQFNSTTPLLQKAKEFAGKAIFKITKSHSGKPIKELSYFQKEEEVLFEPYCQFKVTKISNIVNEMINNISIPLFEIEEIEKAPMPDSTALFLLWVDDKTKEVKETWGSLTSIKKNSVMVQLLSTEELKNWLNNNKTLLKDKTAEFVMVTNMTRVEKGVKNEEAGVEAIKQFKKYMPEGNIFVYIGWVEGTVQKLKKHNLLNVNNKIQVSNSANDLKKFLKVYGGLS